MKNKLIFCIIVILLISCIIIMNTIFTPTLDLSYVYNTIKEYKSNEKADPSIAKSTFDSIGKYPQLANDTELIWEIVDPFLAEKNSRQTAIELLNEYLSKTKHLKLETALTIKGNISMLYMSNGDYGDSIYIFNEIISKANMIKDCDVRARLKIKSYEYLGNMYGQLSDDSAAIEQYNRAINEFVESPTVNASCKYGSYINRVESHIQLDDYEKALESSIEIEKIIPYLSPEISSGVEIFKNKNLAVIESHKQNFVKAKQYLQKCYVLLKTDDDKAFLNSKMYVRFAYCEMLIQEGKTDLAIDEINKLLVENLNQGFGAEQYCYELLAPLYKKTNQTDKFLEVSEKLYESDKEFNDTLKKDYLKYIEESFALDQLREREKSYQNAIILSLIFILICIFLILIIALFLKKARYNNLTDSLTEIYNRKYLTVFMKKKIRTSTNMAVIMADIDYFKSYNDTYGHPAGDKAIKAVADILKESIRKKDKLIRYGGEEFLILLENFDVEGIDALCERIAHKTDEKHIVHESSQVTDYLTLSLGATLKSIRNDAQLSQAIEEADTALYSAKQNGRNQYAIYKNITN